MVLRPILASIIMGIVILKTDFLPLWYAVPIGAVSYFLLFFLLGGFNEHDKETLTDILSMVGFKRVWLSPTDQPFKLLDALKVTGPKVTKMEVSLEKQLP